MIITSEQFVGPLLIEGIHDESVSSDAKKEDLNYFISIYEPQYIDMILGPISSLFIDYLKEENEEERWSKLKDALSINCSPLSSFVFFYYTRNKPFSSTPTGTKSDGVSPYRLCVTTWNEAIPKNKKVYELLSSGDYEGFVFDNSLLTNIW